MNRVDPARLLTLVAVALPSKRAMRAHLRFILISALAILAAGAMLWLVTDPGARSSAAYPLKVGKPVVAPPPAQVDMADQLYKEKTAAPIEPLPAQF